MTDLDDEFPALPDHNHTGLENCPGCLEMAKRAALVMPDLLTAADLYDKRPSRFYHHVFRATASEATSMMWWTSAVASVTIPGWDLSAYTFVEPEWLRRLPKEPDARTMWRQTIVPALRMIFKMAEHQNQEAAMTIMGGLVEDCKAAQKPDLLVLIYLALLGTASERLATFEYSYQKVGYLVCMGASPELFYGHARAEVIPVAMVSGALAAKDPDKAIELATQLITPDNLGNVLSFTAHVISRCIDPDHPEAMVMNTVNGTPDGVIDHRYVAEPLDELDRNTAASVIGLKFVWELMHTTPSEASDKLLGWCREDVEVYEMVTLALLSWLGQYLVQAHSEMAE